jgi:hypothetical protein
MIPRVLPYLPSPRPPAPDLGRRPAGSPLGRALGFVQHLAGILLFIAVPAAFGCGAIYFLLEDEWPGYVRAPGFIVLMPIALVYLKSLLPRRLPVPPAVIRVNPESEPTPYAFLARVAQDVGAPAPRRLWIGSGTELRLRGRRSIFDLVRFGRYDVEIGLWLWLNLTLSEFQAILTRTIAPLSRGRFEQLRLAGRSVLEGLVAGKDFLDEMAETDLPLSALARLVHKAHQVAAFPLRFVGRALLRSGTIESDSLLDDLAAVRITGSDALVHAVLRSDFAAAALEFADRRLERAGRDGIYTSDHYAHIAEGVMALREAHNDFMLGETPTLRGPHAGKYADVFEPGQIYLSSMWLGFPSPPDREQNAKRTFVACERDDRPASELIDDSAKLRSRLTELRYSEVLGHDRDYLSLAPEVVSRWTGSAENIAFPTRCAGVYDGGRAINPGTPQEREAALIMDSWTDARLVRTAAGLYPNAGERAARWRTARTALDKVLRRTVYHPRGRDLAIADDLEEDLRKLGRWFAALDRWVYVIHVHMAARLPDLAQHDLLIKRYETVLSIGPLASDAREYRNRVAGFGRVLGDYDGLAPYRLQREAGKEFKASRKDFELLLKEASAIIDPFIRELTGDISLDQFLYSHTKRPFRQRLTVSEMGRRLLAAWDEVIRKARWLQEVNLAALLELQEQIADRFAAQVGPLPPEEIPEAIVLDPPEDPLLELEPPEIVELTPDEPVPDLPPVTEDDPWWD